MPLHGARPAALQSYPEGGQLSTFVTATKASQINNFSVISSQDFTMQRLTETQQGLIVHHLLNQSVNVGRRLFYDQHTYWIDFSRFVPREQARRVAYINVVREPVARFGSAGTFFGHEQSAGSLKAFPSRAAACHLIPHLTASESYAVSPHNALMRPPALFGRCSPRSHK